MDPLLIPCPQCGKKLRLRDRSLLGKKGKCPKCGYGFQLQQPDEPQIDEVQMELIDSAPAAARTAPQPAVGTSARWIPDDPADAAPPPFTAPVPMVSPPVPMVSPPEQPAGDPQGEFDIKMTSVGGVSQLNRIRKRSSQRTKISLGVGAATAIAIVLAIVFARQASDVDEPPKVNQSYQSEKKNLKEQLVIARKKSPTKGEPISLLYVPAGTQMIFNVHPAALWQKGSLGEEVRFCLGAGINSWAEEQLKAICHFEPAEIEEALICLMFGARGSGKPPEVAAVVRLTEAPSKADLIERWAAERDDSRGRPMYLNEQNAYMLIDTETFAVGPVASASEMYDAMKFPQPTDRDIEELIRYTDRDRHLTIIFEPLDLRNFQDVLVPQETLPFLNLLVDWFGEDVSTVAWSFHLDKEMFHSEMLLRSSSQISSPRRLHKEFDGKLTELPTQVLGAVSKMDPEKLGHRMIIGRFPAMVYGYSLSTLGGIGDHYLQLTTVLPERAAPNLASGMWLTWVESLRTDFTKAAPDITKPKLPDLLADRLKMEIEIDFRDTPLHEAFAYISEESHVPFKLDGDALKAKGMTQNMTQNQKLGDVPAMRAVLAIISRYKDEGMCVVIDESAKLATVMTLTVVEKQGIKESATVKIIRPTD